MWCTKMILWLLLVVSFATSAPSDVISDSDVIAPSDVIAASDVISASDDTSVSDPSNREAKLLPIVKIVSFLNRECTSSGGHEGTCYSQKECTAVGGDALGTCANGFGVCCILKATCDSVIKYNNTYFTSPGFPTSYSTPGMCMSEIHVPKGTCQILLTFEAFDLIGPVAGDCNNDTFVFVGGSPGVVIPVLCGYNGGQHYYVDVKNAHGPFKMVTTISAIGYARLWKIKVTFLQAYDALAPPYCLQYHTKSSGMISSFNHGGQAPQMLNNQNYAICFGCLLGFCDVGLSFSLFDLGIAGGACEGDYIGAGPLQCCGELTSFVISLNVTAGPLILYVASDHTNENLENGFAASYMRMAC